MELGRINGIDEGLVIVWSVLGFTAIVGGDFWERKIQQ